MANQSDKLNQAGSIQVSAPSDGACGINPKQERARRKLVILNLLADVNPVLASRTFPSKQRCHYAIRTDNWLGLLSFDTAREGKEAGSCVAVFTLRPNKPKVIVDLSDIQGIRVELTGECRQMRRRSKVENKVTATGEMNRRGQVSFAFLEKAAYHARLLEPANAIEDWFYGESGISDSEVTGAAALQSQVTELPVADDPITEKLAEDLATGLVARRIEDKKSGEGADCGEDESGVLPKSGMQLRLLRRRQPTACTQPSLLLDIEEFSPGWME